MILRIALLLLFASSQYDTENRVFMILRSRVFMILSIALLLLFAPSQYDINGDILGLGLASAENHSYQIILVID